MPQPAEHTVTANQGPCLLYASSRGDVITPVDHTVVTDPRERAICRALLVHALALLDDDATEAEGVPQCGTRLCHDTDPTTLKECALKAGHPGSHADANIRWEGAR